MSFETNTMYNTCAHVFNECSAVRNYFRSGTSLHLDVEIAF